MPLALMIVLVIVAGIADTDAAIHAVETAKEQAMPLADKDATPAKTFATVALVDAKEPVAAAVPQHPQDKSLLGWEVRKPHTSQPFKDKYYGKKTYIGLLVFACCSRSKCTDILLSCI